MKCEYFSRKLLMLDHGEKPGMLMRIHSLRCQRCRDEEKHIGEIFARVSEREPRQMDRSLAVSIMLSIRKYGIVHQRRISLFKWLSVEAVILSSLVLVQFSEPMIWLKAYYGRQFELPLYLIMGVLITVFTAMLVGSQMKNALDFKDRLIFWIRKSL